MPKLATLRPWRDNTRFRGLPQLFVLPRFGLNFGKINVQNQSQLLKITNAIFEQVNEAFPEQIAEEKTATLCGVLSKLCPGDLARRRSMRAQNQELA